MYGAWYDHHWMSGSGIFLAWIWMGMLILIPLLVLLSLLKFLFGKRTADTSKKETAEIETPLDIIKNSYARGEISREEFLQKRDDLLEK